MPVNVGVIGVGLIGEDHIRRLSSVVAGAEVTAIADADPARAAAVAQQFGGISTFNTGEELIGDDQVDAVVVASWGPTHEQYVLAAIGAEKPVFCEKPLATTSEACLNIVAAEVVAERRLVQVGFMRRYDPAYRALKNAIDGGALGNPLLAHCIHRSPVAAPNFTSEMLINDAAIHEFDILRWLFNEDVVATQVLKSRRNRDARPNADDPLLVLVQMQHGAWVDIEVHMSSHYGYDIRTEVVCDDGTASLAESDGVQIRTAGQRSGQVPQDWRERFVTAYDIELQEWVNASAAGTATGPSAWDGYMATAVSEAATASLNNASLIPVVLEERPVLYT
jgi:myo-inositol 2-dehydrogenase/D-chiro-inositol 1-dehydrogenase